MVSAWPRQARIDYYTKISKRRGDEAAKALGQLVSAVFRGV